MKKSIVWKRLMAVLLCVMTLAGNLLETYAAENPEEPQVMIDVTLENVKAVFDKETYELGDTVNVTLSAEEGYMLEPEFVKLTSEEKEMEFQHEKTEDGLNIHFVLEDAAAQLHASARKVYHVSFSYRDMLGEDATDLFSTSVSPELLLAGTEVKVSVNYSGSTGWTASVKSGEESIDYAMSADSLTFEMPDGDVEILLQEMEDYDKGDLSEEDTVLGEDIGKQHDVSTKKEYEPDVHLGKSAKWDNIEEGLATLTLTEKDTSDWSDNPADYIIVLDRTRTMALNDLCFWSENDDDIGASHSVCLNENHFYLLSGLPVKLIDYSNGMLMSDKSYFTINGSSRELWKRHYNSSGTRITPNLSNGCTDRLTLAQKSIKDIMDVLDEQNQKELAGGLKNRVMYWSFSGPTYKDKNLHPDGLWNEMSQFTTDITSAKNAVKYESYAGTYYNNSFDKVLKEIEKKQKDVNYQNIPTKVIFISDGLQSDADKNATAQMAAQIKAMPNTKIYTILIGNGANSDAGKLLKKYASNESCFATVNSSWKTFVDTITAIQSDQFEIKATEKVLVDAIHTDYWEVIGEPKLEEGNGTASLAKNRTTLTWNIPEGEGKTYTCQLQLKLKDEYRYLLSDTNYPTNRDEEGVTTDEILKDAKKAGAVLSYQILGGKYSGEAREVGIQTPKLKYGTLEFEGTKHWTVEGSFPERLELVLKRTMPGSTSVSEINNTVTNVTKNWKYKFSVRQMPDGSTYPLIKYNNAGQKVDYTVEEEVPEYYVQINKSEKESGEKVISDFYNEPYKIKVQVTKVDEETKSPLSGAEFSVYAWSKKENRFVPYKGTKSTVVGADEVMELVEEAGGRYITPAWLYYAPDNEGKFRIMETKAPEGYFGDWKDANVTNSENDKNVYDFEISKDFSKNGETLRLSNREDETFGNERVKGEICFAKKDVEGKTSVAQGEASLMGAEYKLYAAEDIVHQDGVTGVLHKKDEEIKVRLSANQNGKNVYTYDTEGTSKIETGFSKEVCITGLELGKYYLKEVSASEGYLVNPEIYEYFLAYEGEKTKLVTIEKDVFERVKKQALAFYKLTGNNNSNQLDPLGGAGFSIYLVNDLENGKYSKLTDAEVVQAVIDDLRNPSTLLYDTYKKYQPATVYAVSEDEDVISKKLVKSVTYENGKTYTAEGQNAYFVAELKSDSKGVVKTPALPYGRYVVIETMTPKGKTATRPFIIHVTGDEQDAVTEGDGKGTPLQEQQLTVLVDRPIMSLVRILKRDTHSKEIVHKEGAAYVIHDLESAWFDYITTEMTSAQKREYKKKYGDLVAQYSQGVYVGTRENPFVTKVVEDTNAGVYIETPIPLPNGIYELEEVKAPDGYILQGFEGVIRKDGKNSGNGTFYEKENEGIWEPTPQGRTRFIISSNEAVYDESVMSFVTTVRQDNEPAIGKVSVYVEGEKLLSAEKEKNSDNYKFVYGMKPVEGAQFEIRAAEDIYSQEGDGHAKKLFEKGALIVTLTSDENGQTWTGQEDWEGTEIAKGLPLGKYHVIQTMAGEGFHLSEENKEPREIEITYAGQEVPVIYKDVVYTNPRQQVKIEICKTDAQTGKNLAGAIFGLYTKKEIKDYKNQTIVKAGTLVATAETILDGEEIKNAVFAPELPLGQYEVKELKAPDGYTTNREVFTVNASYQGQEQKYAKSDCEIPNQKTKHLFTKTDLVSGKNLTGAKFEIWEILTDENGKLLKESDGSYLLSEKPFAEWSSVPEGTLIEGLTVGKQYVLREVQAPYGYVGYEASDDETKKLNKEANTIQEEIMFVVPDTDEVVKHEVKNQRVTGRLVITKEGEFLTNAKVSVKDQVKNLFKTVFEYMLGRVENVVFDVYVKEDVFVPDGSGLIMTWKGSQGELVELSAGTKVARVQTAHNGMAILENLPLGKYFVKEVDTGENYNLLLSEEIKELEFVYVDQNTPVVSATNVKSMKTEDVVYVNQCQKVDISIRKYETDHKNHKVPVQGAVFGLYTAETICGYAVDENKKVQEYVTRLMEDDTLLETVESDAQGNVLFSQNLPCGKYYLKEISPAKGYLKSDWVQYIDASYTDQTGEEVLSFAFEAMNIKTNVKVRKTDLLTGKDITGAKLQILEKESGKVVEEWTSDGSAREIFGLALSEKTEQIYVLREIAPAPGYATAQDMELKLVQDKNADGFYGDTWKVYVRTEKGWKQAEELTIEMKDDVTKVEVQKIDKKERKMIAGAKMELRDDSGKTVASWTSSEKAGFVIEQLPIGNYTIVETESPKGYQRGKKITIQVKDTAEKQSFFFENEKKPVKTDETQKIPPVMNLPGTGDGAMTFLWLGILVVSVTAVACMKHRRNS